MKKMLFLAALLVGTALLTVRDAHGGISFSTANNNNSYYGDEDDNPLDNLRKLLKQLFTSEDPLDMPAPRYVPPPAPEPNPYAAPGGGSVGRGPYFYPINGYGGQTAYPQQGGYPYPRTDRNVPYGTVPDPNTIPGNYAVPSYWNER
jgi:hypothetical protein